MVLVIVNGKTFKGLVSAVEYTGDPETCPRVSVQPACNMTAVSSATRPTKPLAAAGVTCSRGERDMRRVSTCCRSAILAIINIHLVCLRCSDGMDRHRQEWLDYACSAEVLFDMVDEYVLIYHLLILMLLFCFIWAEQ